jgi:hypothetical protein
MARKIDCPFVNGGWIELPDVWKGKHARRRDEASGLASEKNLPSTLLRFSVAMAIIENWGGIPGLDGNPELWNLEEIGWDILNWVADVVFTDLNKALTVHRNFSNPSPSG